MPNFFYFDQVNQKCGPVNDQQLQALVEQGVIGKNTLLETEGGHKGLACQIPGLTFSKQGFSKQGIILSSDSEPLNRQTYILLAIVGGWAGWHCKYAGYYQKQMVHFWLVFIGVILLFVFGIGILLFIISQIIAVNEMFYDRDASGRGMKE